NVPELIRDSAIERDRPARARAMPLAPSLLVASKTSVPGQRPAATAPKEWPFPRPPATARAWLADTAAKSSGGFALAQLRPVAFATFPAATCLLSPDSATARAADFSEAATTNEAPSSLSRWKASTAKGARAEAAARA